MIFGISLAFALDAHGPALAAPGGDAPSEPLISWQPEMYSSISFSMVGEAAGGLLVRELSTGTGVYSQALLDEMAAMTLSARLPLGPSLGRKIGLTLELPFFIGSTDFLNQYPPALGDIRLGAPLTMAAPKERRPGAGLVAELLLPTGNTDRWLGNASAGASLLGMVGQPSTRLPWALNLGVVWNAGEVSDLMLDTDLDRRLQAKVSGSLGWQFLPWWGLGLEVWAMPALLGPGDIPSEFLIRTGILLPGGFNAGAAFGRALSSAPGSASQRIYLRLGWAKQKKETIAPVVEEPEAPPSASMLVLVHDEKGDPLNASIRIFPEDGSPMLAETGEDGVESFGIAPGQYTVELSAPDRETQRREVLVSADRFRPAVVEAVLWPGAGEDALKLEVLDIAGDPVEGATVQLNGEDRGTTSTGGTLEVIGVLPSTVAVSVVDPNFLPMTPSTITPGPDWSTLYLRRPPGSVAVVVRTETAPVPEAVVRAVGPGGTLTTEPVGEDGEVALVLEPGAWTLMVSAESYSLQERELVLEPDTPFQEVIFVLAQEPVGDAELIVRVVDPSGQPVVGASVMMDGHPLGTTGSAGILTVAGLMPGKREILVSGPRFREMQPLVVELPPGSREIPVVLAWKPGSVQVVCRGPEGADLDAEVRWIGVEQQDSSLGPDGRAFYSLEPGDWHLILSSPALGLQERDLVVEPDDIHLIEIDAGLLRSEGTSRLTVRVVDPAERPVAGASILVDGQEAGTTSTEGNLLLSGLAEGTHLLRVEGPFFLAHEIELELKNEGEVILKLSWQGSPVRVAARAQGQPVLDAWVRMFGDTTTAEQPVGVDGTHLFVVEPGSWVAVASSSVLGIGERDLQVAPSQREQEAVVEIQPPLEAKARLEVSVVDSQGQPVEGAVLMLDQLVMVAPYGAVTFPDRPVGAVPLKVEAAGYVPWSEPRLALIEGNQSRRVVLKALPRTVSLQITDAEGQPVAVGVRLSQGKKAVQSMSGAELSLQPGRWQVLVSATDTLGAWQGEWVVEPGKGVQALTVQLKPSRVEVAAQEVRIREQVFFAFDRAVLDPRSDAVLAEVAATLLLHPEITRLEVQGHTDNLGGAEYNLELSRRRAEAVRDRLIRLGVDPARLVAVGYGSNKPKASNNSEVGRQQNRRVQFEILHEPAKPE